jgi:hypothetical protein
MTRFVAFVTMASLSVLALSGKMSPLDAETVNCTPITAVPMTITAQGVYCFKQHVATNMSTGVAIQVNVNNVILDLNGYKLQGATIRSATQALGIASNGHRNITIKNGTVRGFAAAIFLLGGGGNVVEDMRVDFNTLVGMNITGVGNIIRNNVVLATGASTLNANTNTHGLLLTGSLHRVLNNEVLDTMPSGTGFGVGISIGAPSEGIVVEGNRVSNASLPQGGGQTRGIQLGSEASNVVMVNNRFTRLSFSIICLPNSTGIIRDNLSIATGGYSGCNNAGNNQ